MFRGLGAWLLIGMMSGVVALADDGAEVDVDDAIARRTCAACTQEAQVALSDRRAYKKTHGRDICAGPENEKIRGKKFFCDPEQKYPDPYAIALVSKQSGMGTKACRYYLLALASKQAKAEVKARGLRNNPDDENDAFDTLVFGGRMADLEPDCYRGNVLTDERLIDDSVKANVMLAAGEDGAASKKYCKLIVPNDCETLGGKTRSLPGAPGKKGCVLSGVVLDASCLKNPKLAKRVLEALGSVKAKSTSCLSGLSPTASSKVAQQFSDADPKSQICCGSKCDSNVYPGADGEVLEGAEAQSGGPANGYGTIRLLDTNDPRPDKMLFHEYLHRIGMCTDANHDNNVSTKTPRDGQCPAKTKYAEFAKTKIVGCKGIVAGKGYIAVQELPTKEGETPPQICMRTERNGKTELLVDDSLKADYLGTEVCTAQDLCTTKPSFYDSTRRQARLVRDPVYACQAACFDSDPKGLKAAELKGFNEGIARVKERCKSAEDHAFDGKGKICE